jgi:hypothetical protein
MESIMPKQMSPWGTEMSPGLTVLTFFGACVGVLVGLIVIVAVLGELGEAVGPTIAILIYLAISLAIYFLPCHHRQCTQSQAHHGNRLSQLVSRLDVPWLGCSVGMGVYEHCTTTAAYPAAAEGDRSALAAFAKRVKSFPLDPPRPSPP